MESEKKPEGAFIGLAVIIIILIVGGIYVWRAKIRQLEQIKIQNSAAINNDVNTVK